MNARHSAHVTVMIDAAEKAGRALIRDFGEVEQLQVSRKGAGHFVSTADLKSEKILLAELAKTRPSFGMLSREAGEIKGADTSTRWIVDPLNGSLNFLHGLPHWAISIAIEKDKEIVAGVIYDPLKNDMFWAEKGGGAFMSSKRLRVTGRTSLEDCFIAVSMDETVDFVRDITATVSSVRGVRRMGSPCLDLAYVAAGRFDACWERSLQPWETAAGGLMVRESGGFVSDINGGKDYIYGRSICAANQTLQTYIVKTLKNSNKKEPAQVSS